MRIAIVSTRGIPNNYGGFEQFAQYLSMGLVKKGHQVTVYSPHFHPYKQNIFEGVNIKHIYSPEKWMGSSIGSFFYDFMSIKDALKRREFDIIYVTGYTSIAPTFLFFNIKKISHPVFITNMDGLEWKRSKFNILTQLFIHWEEKIATSYSKHLISDNKGIQIYYQEKYKKFSNLFAYGATIHSDYSIKHIGKYNLTERSYYLVIARLEPENNIEMIISGYVKAKKRDNFPLVIIGKLNTSLAKQLIKKYLSNKNIIFLGGIYDFKELNSIRFYSYQYFHGHSVGGTNPSLLEAMASGCHILCHDNPFNRSVIGECALYFSSSSDISKLLSSKINEDEREKIKNQNINQIKNDYSWENIVNQYERFFESIL